MESPGTLFNTIGEIEDQAVITVSGEQTYPTEGSLNLTTVFVAGAPISTVRPARRASHPLAVRFGGGRGRPPVGAPGPTPLRRHLPIAVARGLR